MILNVLKIVFFVLSRKTFRRLFMENTAPRYLQLVYSPFCSQYLGFFNEQPLIQAVTMISLQLASAQENIRLLNDMSSFRAELSRHFQSAEIIFIRGKCYCAKVLVFAWTFTIALYIQDFTLIMQQSFESVLVYSIYCLPYVMNEVFLTYFFIIVQFINCSQAALNSMASEASSNKELVSTISQLHSSLYAIKRSLEDKLRLQIVNMVLYSVGQIVGQVIRLK